ncbi:hypothetical protein HHK36_011710 [Tetracentron sinense]|uniref:Uncharacterized protein n=1 Tax=Tetracentron sinense TaxID=13715 RepID=A0A835DHJ4_TETSI|nr:hypothetical protein HHK36_011710 [Tetracentron sinense]
MGSCCISSLIDEGSVESHRYYLSRRTVFEMLRDRCYDVPDSEIDLSLQDFRSIYGQKPDLERLRISVPLLSDPSKRILVIFCGTDVVKVSIIRGISSQIVNKDNLTGVMLILQNKITSQAQQAVDVFPFKVEIFQITDLLMNITKHILMPKHEILTNEEKQKLLKKLNLEDNQIPRMLKKDAIARYYGLEKGQVVKSTYDGEITDSHVSYRCVM